MILSRVTLFRFQERTRPMLYSMALLVLALNTSVSQAQQTPDMVFEPAPGSTPEQASASAHGFPQSHINGSPQPEDSGVGGFGTLGRVGHIAGSSIERSQSITYFDLSPFMFVENTYLFGDGRLFLTNQGRMGGSAGLGVRQYFPRNDFVLGASAWYDQDESRAAPFKQLGMSFEMFSQWMDIRSNYYTGIGENVRELGTTIAPGSAAFSGNNITFSTLTALSTGADMVDLSFTVPVPGDVTQSMNLEATAGYYQIFTPSLGLKDINGYKLRLDADFLDRVLHVYTELSHDSFFDTNMVIAADVNYWHHLEARPRLGSSQYNRIAQWVRRNRNVVTIDSTVTNPDQLAINPNTGNPYFLYHVRNVETPPPNNFPAPAGTGSIDTPFQFIDEAQVAVPDADLIFVHADSVFDNRPLVMNGGELILGEGVNQSIPVQGLSQPLVLPRATNGANRPLFRNTVGTAVTLANNTTFAGFEIDDTQGTALFGSGISNSTLRDITIDRTTGAASHGVHLQDTVGRIVMQNVEINDTEGNAFFVSGGNSTIVYSTGTINNTSGYAILVEGNTGSVNMSGTTTTDTGGQGVRVANSNGSTTLGTLRLINTTSATGNALEIAGLTGSVSLFDDVTITNPAGNALDFDNISGSVSSLGAITINQRNGIGVDLTNINANGAIVFSDAITMGTPNGGGVDEFGINFQSSEGIVSFGDVTINGSNGAGVNIGDRLGIDTNTGQFLVAGDMDISGATGSSIQILNDSSEVRFTDTTISERGGLGIEILNHSGTASFIGLTTVRNENGVGNAGIDIQDTAGAITFGTTNVTDAAGPDPGVNITNNTGGVTINSLSVTSDQTTAVSIIDNSSVTILGGTIEATSARGVTMIDNESFNVAFDSVSSTDSDFGILVDNDPLLFDQIGTFRVLGNGQTLGSGGTISGQTVAAASFSNVNVVDLEFMELLSNEVGVVTTDVKDLTLIGNEVTGSTSFGLDVLDSEEIMLQENLFDSNLGFNQVRIVASNVRNPVDTPDDPRYLITIRNNIFRDVTDPATVGLGDMISISNVATANNSALRLIVENNGRTIAGGFAGFLSNRLAGDAALSTVWNGDVVATYTGNNIQMSDLNGQVGVRLTTSRAGAVNDIVYSGNVLNDGGGSFDTGLDFDFAGRTGISIINNFGLDANGNIAVQGFSMQGRNDVDDIAMDLTFRNSNNIIDISRNQVLFDSRGGTAVLFNRISGPSQVNMDGNNIVLFDDGLIPEARGIVFQSVVGTISLSSLDNQDNIILPNGFITTIPFSIPAGVSTGGLLINGTVQP